MPAIIEKGFYYKQLGLVWFVRLILYFDLLHSLYQNIPTIGTEGGRNA
ncbi:hypothetical protein DFP75_101383 [Marinomonas alcarazii]|uniref:Uncharacterized protein n=1 Tax=Marinomonas alcarazii TaxID=491949 RepID=A0A318VA05_9GAMM|nr:hypothetical protein DFP75_101383 [Marinomonas alcarazii]